jgi:hypothetical protein
MFENGKAKKAIEVLKPELLELDKKLTAAERIADPFDRLVAFFNVVSAWQDREQEGQAKPVAAVLEAARDAGKKQSEAAQALETLQGQFSLAGRNIYGMNRTVPGQQATTDNVFLGNVHGRWTFTAAKWREMLAKPSPDAAEDRRIIEGQAAGFVADHATCMHKAIQTLTAPGR